MNKVLGILLVLLMLALSGCIDEKKDTSHIPTATPQPEIENIGLDIDITSYSRMFIRDNVGENNELVDEIFPRYYISYGLSITNNGSDPINFSLDDFHIYSGDQVFNATNLAEPEKVVPYDIRHNLEVESNLSINVILPPDQTLSRSVVFKVDNHEMPLLLKYDTTTITSTSFEKSLVALTTAEYFNYSPVFGKPPYKVNWEFDTYNPEPNIPYNDIWSNWINRSVFEYYNKTDAQLYRDSRSLEIPGSEIVYVLKIVPESNITLLPGDDFVIVNDKGEEIINRSVPAWESKHVPSIAILSGETYKHYSKDIPEKNFSNATIVRMSFGSNYGWPLARRYTFNDQYVIVDEEQNILLVRYVKRHLIS